MADSFFPSTQARAVRPTGRRPREIPNVCKSGSSSSPNVISPQPEGDFFLAGDKARRDTLSDALPGTMPEPQSSTALPLFSPSEVNARPSVSISQISNMNESMAFADANPTCFSLPTPPDSEPRHQLRLPSFDMLGIGAPHPDDSMQTSDKFVMEPFGVGSMPWPSSIILPESEPDVDLRFAQRRGTMQSQPLSPLDVRRGPQCNIDVLTPPDDEHRFHWRPLLHRAAEFPPPLHPPALVDSSSIAMPALPTEEGSDQSQMQATEQPEGWLEAAIRTIVYSLNFKSLVGHSLKVLSHALPSPSIPGHAFPNIIDQLRCVSPASSFTWVNLLHAVPGRFNLADLPRSPPSTPGLPLGGGDDYFTTKVFESAVTAVDYDQGAVTAPLHSQPLAPPCSINLSIVERYIPPTSANEFANLFNTKAPSLLIDRLVELSPGNSCLVFIYPTKKGAKTFMQDYLGPILDPLLRAMVVINNFSADLSTTLGRMTAVDRLLDFETMRRRSVTLCDELNGNSVHVRQRLHSTRGHFSLVYASKQEVELERDVWADWWVKQEKPRVRAAVAKYFRLANRLPSDAEVMPTSLIQEILEGVATRDYVEAPSKKIEVGVFVLKRAV